MVRHTAALLLICLSVDYVFCAEPSHVFASTQKLRRLAKLERQLLVTANYTADAGSWPPAFLCFLRHTAAQRLHTFDEDEFALEQYRLIRRFVYDWPGWRQALRRLQHNVPSAVDFLAKASQLSDEYGGVDELSEGAFHYSAFIIQLLNFFYGDRIALPTRVTMNEALELTAINLVKPKDDWALVLAPLWLSIAIKERRRALPYASDMFRFERLLRDADTSTHAPDRRPTISAAGEEALRLAATRVEADMARMEAFLRDEADSDIVLRACNASVEVVAKANNVYCFYFRGLLGPYAPFRYELLSVRPFVAVIHNIISSSVSQKMIEAAESTMRASPVATETGGKDIHFDSRLSESGSLVLNEALDIWFEERIRAATLLRAYSEVDDTVSGEMTSVINYGIGGYYHPHDDHFNDTLHAYSPEMGDRLATVMTYLSSTKDGGNTAFPFLDISVRPETGKAVFWFNLDPITRQALNETMHNACPVIDGNKWIANKWIRELHNEKVTIPSP